MVTIHHNRWAKAETQMGGYNLSRLTCAPRQTSQWVTELPRCTVEGNFRIWKAMKGLREVKWGRGSGREGDVMGTIAPRLMNILCRWLGCGRKSPVWEESSYQWYAVTWANWQSLSPYKRKKLSKLPTLRRQIAKIWKMRGLDPRLWSKKRRSLPVPPEVPLTNGKLWRWKEGVDNDSELEKVNLIKMVQSSSQVRSSAAQKRQTVLMFGDSILRGTFASQIISLEKCAACWGLAGRIWGAKSLSL